MTAKAKEAQGHSRRWKSNAVTGLDVVRARMKNVLVYNGKAFDSSSAFVTKGGLRESIRNPLFPIGVGFDQVHF
jgi:hypothetical protein